ncbi:hypothetical protein JZU54_03370, partial [bacterium]|nr:hypothetical protein [bacterium]
MLTTLAVTSYFNAIRGMTRRSAVKHLANTLILARQRACMEGTRVSVMVFNEVVGYEDGATPKLAPSYVVCKEVGRISYTSTGKKPALIDEFAALEAGYLGSTRLYNLSQGKWSNVLPSVKEHLLTSRASALQKAKTGAELLYDIPAYGFVVNKKVPNLNAAKWSVGDSYGIEVAPINSLPRNFEFDDLKESVSKVVCVTFEPDGSVSQVASLAIRT